jgi:hypothetical protein
MSAAPKRRPLGLLALAAALAGSAAAQTTPPPLPPPQDDLCNFENIVVTGQRGSPSPQPDPVEFLRRFCFEPLRQTRRAAPPVDQPRWEELEEKTRAEFRVADPSVPAYSFVDQGRGHLLLLKFEQFTHPTQVLESRCTLVVIGGRDHARLQAGMSKLFRRPGVEKHVGQSYGTPFLAGWRQWAWTGMPGRRSKNWRALDSSRNAQGGGFLVVTDPSFYDQYDYILGDLKMKEGAERPVSMLSFSHFRRR